MQTKPNILMIRFGTGLKLVGLVCLIVVAALSAMSSSENRHSRSMPALQGAAAVDYLKEQGLYESLISTAAAASPFSFQAYLKASNTNAGDYFGFSVALAGDTAVIGAPREASSATGINGNSGDNSAELAGAVYVFVREGIFWKQQAYLKASNTDAGDQFGYAVALSGETLVVSAPYEDSGSTGINGDGSDNSVNASGAVYVFVRSGATWSQEAYIKTLNPDPLDQFGFSVAISGETIVAGAVDEDSSDTGVNGNQFDNSASGAGAAFVFVRDGTTWSQQAYLKASNTGSGDQFGQSVGVSGNTVLVGARLEDSNATGINGNGGNNQSINSGAVYVFVRSGAIWSQQAYLKASNTGSGDQFGSAVLISGDTVIIGAPNEDSASSADQNNNSVLDSGAVYVFTRTGTAWSQQAYLKAPNAESTDQFGRSLAISGSMLMVGAPNEDSGAKEVDGSQTDNSALNSGAAYVFVRMGTTWNHQTYLKASNTEASDFFGISVAISGDTVLAGAYQEDSNATGSNGNEFDNSAESSGAAFIYAPPNTAPKIVAGSLSRIAGNAVLNSQIATVNDAEDEEDKLTATINGASSATVSGVTISGISISAAGSVTADIVAAADAKTSAFNLRMTDTEGFFTEVTLIVNVITATLTLDNPFECLGPGSVVGLSVQIGNTGITQVAAGLSSAIPANLPVVPGSCAATTGACTIQNSSSVTWAGDLAAGQSATVRFKAQVAEGAPKGQQLCISTDVSVGGGLSGTLPACVTVNCEAIGLGADYPARSIAGDLKSGSVLIYNIVTSSADGRQQNTRFNITNTEPTRSAYVHIFLIDGATGNAAGFNVRLTPNQTATYLASDFDPGTTGFLIAVATDPVGCPVNHNFLIGDEYVRFSSGYQANLTAMAVSAIVGSVPVCDINSMKAVIAFDGVSYGELPQGLIANNLPSIADGNETLLILNRIGGDLTAGAATLEQIAGIIYDDLEAGVSFTYVNKISQFTGTLSNNLPRTAPRYDRIIPAGRTGWMRIWQSATGAAMTGAMINYNRNAEALTGAFKQGHNLHVQSTTGGATLAIPVN